MATSAAEFAESINRHEIPSASAIICAPKHLLQRHHEIMLEAAAARNEDADYHLDVGDDDSDYVVCMLRRSARSSFMADALVFPGGAMEYEDTALAASLVEQHSGSIRCDALTVCAARETFEESGVCLLSECDGDTFPGGKAGASAWRKKVHNDATQFREMLSALGDKLIDSANFHRFCRFVTPDMEAARGGKGFDASFLLSVLTEGQLAASQAMSSDRKETTSMLWTTPRRALQLFRNGEAFLARSTYMPCWLSVKCMYVR